MNKVIKVLVVALVLSLSAQLSAKETLKISSTIGPVDAGIVPLLAEDFTKKFGIDVVYEKAGTGATLNKAKTGNFDLVMVHARKLEDKFIADGYGFDRRDVMYNDFVILGPKSDPAKIKGITNVTKAFKMISNSGSHMVTRGDNSGTHVKEMEIWSKSGVRPTGKWYETFIDGAKGNKATTLYADQKDAYVLMDRATWLTLKEKLKLTVLVEKDPLMLNYIAIIRVSPKKFPNINKDSALKFADYLISDEAQEKIRTFGVDKYKEPLFFPNAKANK